MATNEKPAKESKAVAKTTSPRTVKSADQDFAAVAANAAGVVGDVYNGIVADEAAKDDTLDQMAAQALADHLEKLKDKSISEEQREKIREKFYERLDKERSHRLEHKKENTKRINGVLWWATVLVLGTAALKYAPDIINACLNRRKV